MCFFRMHHLLIGSSIKGINFTNCKAATMPVISRAYFITTVKYSIGQPWPQSTFLCLNRN